MPENSGVLYGVGVGPGDPDLLTLKAVKVFEAVDVIYHVVGPRSRESISQRVVDSVDSCQGKSEALVFSMSTDYVEREASVRAAAERVAAVLTAGKSCAFATIGDPLVYSTFSYLHRQVLEILPEARVEIVPGITCFQAAASEWGEPLVEDEEVLTVVPRWNPDRRHQQAIESADTVVCLKTYRDRADVLGALDRTLEPEQLLYALRVGNPDQHLETDIDKIAELPIEYLSLLVAKRGTPSCSRKGNE